MRKILSKLIILIMGLALLTGCFTTPPSPEPDGVVYRAFFVGISKYENGMTLPSPAKNTDKLEDLFTQCKFGENETQFQIIEKLINLDATKENILNGIDDAFYEADDNDVSYFYYMGHGGVKGGTPVITATDSTGCICKNITVHELEARLSMISGTKVVLLETCHAGNFIDKGKKIVLDPFDKFSLDLLNKEGYQVLASSAGDEYTWDFPNGSPFCNALINGCKNLTADSNEDEIVDISELYHYIKLHVIKQTVQIYPENSIFPITEF